MCLHVALAVSEIHFVLMRWLSLLSAVECHCYIYMYDALRLPDILEVTPLCSGSKLEDNIASALTEEHDLNCKAELLNDDMSSMVVLLHLNEIRLKHA